MWKRILRRRFGMDKVMLDLKVRYMNSEVPLLRVIPNGDGVDTYLDRLDVLNGEQLLSRQFERVGYIIMEKGDVATFGLGFSAEIPKGYYAELIPRSSTFKNSGLVLVNSVGLIDSSYNGDNDEWLVQVMATKETVVYRHDRYFQFTLKESIPVNILEVEELGNDDRGGIGSTGDGVLNEVD